MYAINPIKNIWQKAILIVKPREGNKFIVYLYKLFIKAPVNNFT